jgi:hypothetical protein
MIVPVVMRTFQCDEQSVGVLPAHRFRYRKSTFEPNVLRRTIVQHPIKCLNHKVISISKNLRPLYMDLGDTPQEVVKQMQVDVICRVFTNHLPDGKVTGQGIRERSITSINEPDYVNTHNNDQAIVYHS